MDSTVFTAPYRAASTQPVEACANCEAPRMGEYCFACGQHFLEGRLTIRRLVRDFVVRKLGLEGGLLRTMVDLTVRPASMIRQYVDGRRQRYTNPVAYLLLAAGAYVVLSRAWRDVMEAGIRAANTGVEGVDVESMVQVQLYMDSHPSLTTLLLCLFLVPALRLLFRGTTNVAEASVFSLFVSGHLLLIQIVLNIGALLLATNPYRVMTGAITIVPALVLLFSAGRFFGTGFSGLLRMAVALFVSLVGLVLLMVIAGLILSVAAAGAPGVASA